MSWTVIAICAVVYLGTAFLCTAWVAARDGHLGWPWTLALGCFVFPILTLFLVALGLLLFAGKIWVVWWLLSLISGIPGPNEVLL